MKKKEEEKAALNEIQFKLPVSIKFPEFLFKDCKSMDDIRKVLTEHFVAVQEKDVIANRLMTVEEVSEIRERYGNIMEDSIPKLEEDLSIIEADFNLQKKEFKNRISAARTEFSDLVSLAKKGIKDFPLNMQDTFRIPVCGHYLYYTWIDDCFKLAMVQEIPKHEYSDLFNSGEKNEESFKKMGYELPNVEIKDIRVNVRKFENTEYGDIEVWEEKGEDVWMHSWIEDLLDGDKGEVISSERREWHRVPFEESPFRDGTYVDENEQTGTQEGETDKVSEPSEE